MRTFNVLLTSALLLGAAPNLAESKGLPPFSLGEGFSLDVDGQYRPRFVGHTGKDFKDAASPAYVTQRARLGVTLAHEVGVSLTVRLQDTRVWGEETNTLNDSHAEGFDVHEAFAKIPLYIDGLELILGRQEIVWGTSRLLGNVGWTQRARSFDALRIRYRSGDIDAEGFYSKVIEADKDGDGHLPEDHPSKDTDFGGFDVGWKFAKGHKISLLYLGNADYFKRHERHTVGLLAKGKQAGVHYAVEGYYQAGSMGTNSVSAYMAAGQVGYTADVTTKPSLTLWGEYLSGDGTAHGTFDTLYATNHKFYGEMDKFLAIPKNTKNLGLIDAGGKIVLTPWKGYLKFMLAGHYLMTAEKAPGDRQMLGPELDIKLIITPYKFVSIRALYAVFIPQDAWHHLAGVADGTDLEVEHFAYITTDVKF